MKGLAYAKTLAREFGATLVLLHSVDLQYYVSSEESARYDFPRVLDQVTKVAQGQMRDLIKMTNWDGIRVESTIEIGHAGQQVCDRAEDRQADLVVTSTHGRTGLKHVLMGSTAEFVARFACCPVLVVPTHSKSVFH